MPARNEQRREICYWWIDNEEKQTDDGRPSTQHKTEGTKMNQRDIQNNRQLTTFMCSTYKKHWAPFRSDFKKYIYTCINNKSRLIEIRVDIRWTWSHFVTSFGRYDNQFIWALNLVCRRHFWPFIFVIKVIQYRSIECSVISNHSISDGAHIISFSFAQPWHSSEYGSKFHLVST